MIALLVQLDLARLGLAHLDLAHLDLAHLDLAHLDLAHLDLAHLDFAHLDFAHLDFVCLGLARLDLVHLDLPRLDLVHLGLAHLDLVHLGASLNGADFVADLAAGFKGVGFQPAWFPASHWVIVGLLTVFAIAHSGLAALRSQAEAWIGPRAYRIFFALVSLPLATAAIIYFFGHRYDGVQLWQLQGQAWVLPTVWILSAISFLFLYPATFNLLEIAAIQKPTVHLYETGIIRVTRHPQATGQVIWCIAHLLWIGTTFTLVTSLALVAHHLFGVWHGDRRLAARYGDAFAAVKARTSVIPFGAIARGQQTLVWREFLRPAYLGVAAFTLGFWWAHPALIRATGAINW